MIQLIKSYASWNKKMPGCPNLITQFFMTQNDANCGTAELELMFRLNGNNKERHKSLITRVGRITLKMYSETITDYMLKIVFSNLIQVSQY